MLFPIRPFLLLLFLLPLTHLSGQRGLPPPEDEPAFRQERLDRVRAAQEAFMTTELDLSKKQAAAFFPLFWENEARQRAARRNTITAIGELRRKEDLTETEARRMIDLRREEMKKLLALRISAEDAYLKVLPATKVARLPAVERRFREELWQRRREMMDRRPGGRRRN